MRSAGSARIGVATPKARVASAATSSSSSSSSVTSSRAVTAAGVAASSSSSSFSASAMSSSSPSSPSKKDKPCVLQRVQFEVHGKVQGVYFRKFTQQQAVMLGLCGWVKNTDQGTVIGEAEGRIDKLIELKHWLSTKGSPKSRIERAEFSDQAIDARRYTHFLIDKSNGGDAV